ncbi:MAG: hypothetical protein ACP5OA_04650 [Candidatus Woesearchaeota archaeon]
MCLDKLMEKFSRNLKWYDVPLLKLCVFFFTLFLVVVWSGFRNLVLSFAWYWYLIIGVMLAIPLLRKLF